MRLRLHLAIGLTVLYHNLILHKFSYLKKSLKTCINCGYLSKSREKFVCSKIEILIPMLVCKATIQDCKSFELSLDFEGFWFFLIFGKKSKK
jgi:recombinational DNA repair protein RecR